MAILSIGLTLGGVACAGKGLGLGKTEAMLFSGTIERQEIRVGSKVGGRVSEVLAREGDILAVGAPLVRFDIAELKTLSAQAEARIAQQTARLERLEKGSRPEEREQAHAATEAARAALDAVKTWPRPEELAQVRAAVAGAEADRGQAQTSYDRVKRLRETGDLSQQEMDAARFRLDQALARLDGEKRRLELLTNGSRKEEIRAADERLRQASEFERLVRSGPRVEEIRDARAQLDEARARLEQIQTQMAEGTVSAPARAVVEVLTVRPGDLILPNQVVARLLEDDQIWIRIYVPEPKLGLVRIGQKVKIKIDTFKDRTFSGIVEQINAQGEFTPRNIQSRDERDHQVFGVKVRIDNREGLLKSGMAADVSLD